MEYQLLGISGLILIILFLTWLKDGEKMDPPLKKRFVIDLTTIALFWVVFEFVNHMRPNIFEKETIWVINGSLIFFFGRMMQMVYQINPMLKDLSKYLESKNEEKEK
ncbi:hypothetical protein [Lactococcus lactis]|nr:hypothetical protein [Lactococcus lactis]KAA8701165.1 holin [Lactococcus lactis subsp. hordniae]MCT3134327.1 holin [Lactococcus lactis]